MRKLAAFRKLSSPFVGDKPLDSISLCFYGDSTGIKMWNNPNDPMPIKTINMAGLQKWEETEDYIIYLCKDATMTTVQNYVTGTFQTFQERVSDIESSKELMKSYSIEWTEQDSINLINEINNEALAKIKSNTMMLPVDSEEFVNEIQVLSSRTVPVTYECCFRMDKKSGEFYIGEAYENLISDIDIFEQPIKALEKLSGYQYKIISLDPSCEGWKQNFFKDKTGTFAVVFDFSNNVESFVPIGDKIYGDYRVGVWGGYKNGAYSFVSDGTNSQYPLAIRNRTAINILGTVVNIQITKTSTPKPFVKSVMPSGKLAFVTPATSETHSFIGKNFKTDYKGTTTSWPTFYCCGTNNYFERVYVQMTTQGLIGDFLVSNSINTFNGKNTSKPDSGVSENVFFIGNTPPSVLGYRDSFDSFTQLLLYKANLTEAELKAELAKDIKLR